MDALYVSKSFSSSEQASAPTAALKSSFPVDALYVSKSFVPSPEVTHHDEYEDTSYDMQSSQWMQVSRLFYSCDV